MNNTENVEGLKLLFLLLFGFWVILQGRQCPDTWISNVVCEIPYYINSIAESNYCFFFMLRYIFFPKESPY